MRCRYYENQFPEPEEVVIVNVTQIGEMGAYVTLLEYDDIEGMILLSELSRRRIRSINKLVRVNRTEIVKVIRVDKEKGECSVLFYCCLLFHFKLSETHPRFLNTARCCCTLSLLQLTSNTWIKNLPSASHTHNPTQSLY